MKTVSHLRARMMRFIGDKKKFVGWGIVAILIFAGLFWYISPYLQKYFAQFPKVATTITPSQTEVQVGDPVTLSVSLSGQKLMAVDMVLTYDGSLVTYPAEVAGQSGYTKLSEDTFQAPIKEEVLPGEGNTKKLHLVLVTQAGNLSAIKDALLFNLAFTSKAGGTANFVINTETKLSGIDSGNLPTYFDPDPESASASVTIAGTQYPPIDGTFTPSKSQVALNEEFQVDMSITGQTDTSDISAVDLFVTYDSAIASYATEYGLTTGFVQATGGYFDAPLIERVENDATPGKKTLRITLISQKPSVRSVTFGLKFKGMAEGIANFAVNSNTKIVGQLDGAVTNYRLSSPLSASVTVGEGVPTPTFTLTPTTTPQAGTPTVAPTVTTGPGTPTTAPTVTAGPNTPTVAPTITTGASTPTTAPTGGQNVTLELKTRFQGITGLPPQAYRALSTKVILASGDGSVRVEKTATFTPNSSGVWTGQVSASVPTAKKYAIFIKGPKHIMKKVCVTNPTERAPGYYKCTDANITLRSGSQTLDFTNIILLAGDIPEQDGIIDSLDASFVRNNFGSTDPAVIARGDLNLDGIVHSQDMVLMYKALEFKYDDN